MAAVPAAGRPPSRRSSRHRYLLLSLLAMGFIWALGYGAFAVARREVIAHAWDVLEGFTEGWFNATTAWIVDRRQEALRFYEDRHDRETAIHFLRTGEAGPAWADFEEDFSVLLQRPQYQAILFVAADGRLLRSYGDSPIHSAAELPRLDGGEITFSDFRAADGGTRFLMNTPFLSGGRYVGSMLFVLDPYREVGRYLGVTESMAESVLLFRPAADGTLVMLNSANAHGGSGVLPSDPARLLTRAAAVGSGRVTGLSREGGRAIGVVRPITGTPWFLLAQMRWRDAYAPMRHFAAYNAALTLALLALVGGVGYSRWRRAEAQLHADLLASELARSRATRRLGYMARYAYDAILLLDDRGRITEVNERAVEMYGYAEGELLRMTIGDLRAPVARTHMEADWDALLARGAFLTETVHRKKGGEEFPIESSWRVIDLDNERVVQAIIRDITERKRSEDRITKLGRLYRTLSGVNEATLRQDNEPALLGTALEIARKEAQFVAAWIARPVPAGGYMAIDRFSGDDEADFRALMTPEITRIDAGIVTFAHAYRDGHCTYHNGFMQDAPLPVRDWVRAHHVGSAASFPVTVGDTVELVLGVYSREDAAFDAEVVQLLQRMADNLGFALLAMRRGAALYENEERLSLVLEATGGCYWDIRFDQRFAFFSLPLARLFGLPQHPLSLDQAEAAVSRVIAPEYLDSLKSAIEAHLRGDSPELLCEYRALSNSGSMRWYRVHGKVVERDGEGRPLRMTGTNADIEEERRAGEQLRLWASVFEHSRELILITDAAGRVVSVNAAFSSNTGYGTDELLGRDAIAIAAESSARDYESSVRVAAELGNWQGELQARKKDGGLLPVWAMLTSVHDREGQVTNLIWIASDLSEEHAAKERIQRLFYYDGLTGLPNRNLFRERLDEAISSARPHRLPVAVMVLDIDNFKAVNDTFGYVVGDRLLSLVGERLATRVGEAGTVARRGDDEFLVFITNLPTGESAAEVAQGLIDEVARPARIDSAEIFVTATVGISLFPTDGQQSEALISSADAALYFSKEGGRSRFRFFFEQLNVRARERLRIQGGLRRAIEQGDLVMHYQPQVDARSGRPLGAEALVRWRQDDHLIPPGQFISVAEETGLIIPLGDWVVEEVCRQCRVWRGDPRMAGMVTAFNLSAVQFREQAVMERVSGYLRSHCETGGLELELTESMVMEDVEESAKTLRQLKESGLRLAIDDFGTGYSSLAYLRRFPIDRLKVDQSFVRDLGRDQAARSITQAIISLAGSLEIEVLAEGVETAEEMELLHERGCDHVQGYYFSPPLPAAEFEAWWSIHSRGASPERADPL